MGSTKAVLSSWDREKEWGKVSLQVLWRSRLLRMIWTIILIQKGAISFTISALFSSREFFFFLISPPDLNVQFYINSLRLHSRKCQECGSILNFFKSGVKTGVNFLERMGSDNLCYLSSQCKKGNLKADYKDLFIFSQN